MLKLIALAIKIARKIMRNFFNCFQERLDFQLIPGNYIPKNRAIYKNQNSLPHAKVQWIYKLVRIPTETKAAIWQTTNLVDLFGLLT